MFEAEVCGALLGLDLIRATPRATRATLFIDCQPAISAIRTPKAQPGQYLLDTFRTELQRLQKQRQNLRLEIHWVPGHEDIEANEWVDAEAKTAAQGPEANQPGRLRLLTCPLPPPPVQRPSLLPVQPERTRNGSPTGPSQRAQRSSAPWT